MFGKRQMISEITGFDEGIKFESPEDVKAYFTMSNMDDMVGREFWNPDDAIVQLDLDEWAECVIDEGWHCDF